ncbi:MAG: phospho-N-acetylmuramoyl-pentapeptide-transferase, partial [Deltaproteobacteria bacterium]|nr:phospho-N-acetylmuramoyl-pentapeptide-transferase [Deltaproteobacteria bacterium]
MYNLLLPFADSLPLLNVLRYITFRSLAAALLALLFAFVFGPRLIRVLKAGQIRQPVSEYAPEGHAVKQGTPTMGGILIIMSLLVPVLLLADLQNFYVLITVVVIAGYGSVGAMDDFRKISLGSNEGLSGRSKLAWQALIAGGVMLAMYVRPGFDSTLAIPFFKDLNPDLGLWYIPFAVLVVVGTSNAVNLTDGLDGLAIG